MPRYVTTSSGVLVPSHLHESPGNGLPHSGRQSLPRTSKGRGGVFGQIIRQIDNERVLTAYNPNQIPTQTLKKMARDPVIGLGLRSMEAPVVAALTRGGMPALTGGRPEARALLKAVLTPIFRDLSRFSVRGSLRYGFSPA